MSKHTARYYLESGLIPATDTGKHTRRYKIATKDVVAFFIEGDKHPQEHLATEGWYRGRNGYKTKQHPGEISSMTFYGSGTAQKALMKLWS